MANELQKTRDTVTNTASNARESGNALLARLANELSVALANTELRLGDTLQVAMGSLSREDRALLANLDRFRRTVEEIRPTAFDLKDALVLDVTNVLEGLPLVKYDFFLQRIDGIVQLRRDGGEYRLRFWGKNLGPQSGRSASTVKHLWIDGKEVPFRVNRTQANVSEVWIGSQALEKLFAAHDLRVVEAKVGIEALHTHRKWIGSSQAVEETAFPFYISLMPQYYGHVKVTYYRPVYEWKKALENEPIFWVTPDHDQHGGDVRHFDHTDSRTTEKGTRFVARNNFEGER